MIIILENITISIITSLIAAFIFWCIFDYFPRKKKYTKIRPLVDNYIYWVHFYLLCFLSRPFYYTEGIRINNQRQLCAGLLTKADFELALQNKCLNDTYKFDENKNKLMSIGNKLKSDINDITQRIKKLESFLEFMSSEEIMLLEEIEFRLSRENYNISASPSGITNMSQEYYITNMFRMYQLFLDLRHRVIQFKTVNIFDDVSENQIVIQRMIDLYYSHQYEKCTKSINKNEKNIGLLWCKCLSEYQLNHKKNAYKLLETILSNPRSSLPGSREWVKPLLNDQNAINLFNKFKSKEELIMCKQALNGDDALTDLFKKQNMELKKYYENKYIKDLKK